MVKWGGVELPGYDAPIVAVTQERRDAFAANLRELVAERKRKRAAKEPEPLPPDEAAKVATACGLCRGYCCRTGGNEAYLNPRTINRVWDEQAHLTADELVAAYLAWVPERSFKDSCIFHAERGCNLTPSMRSNVCHEYECGPLRRGLGRT